MLESSVLRYCMYGSCVIISSEILYHSYVWLKNWVNKRSSTQEIHEVIWTNELTQSCVARHRLKYSSSSGGGGDVVSPLSPPSNRIKSMFQQVRNANHDCSNPYCAAYNVGRLIEFIDSAKYSIDLAMYTFTSFEMSQAFIRALQRDVLIRIISDREMAYSSGSQIIPLTKTGIPVRCNCNTMLMHHKFCIIDSPQRVASIIKRQIKPSATGHVRSILLTGSLNWTMQGFGGNWENILITSNMKHINKYSQEFERLWDLFDVDLENRK